ncbi:hypothetical protein ABT324_00475 [Saccharopolyspora sp. NPDC000359]|uniref:hypothetical protein n=1 Tax=Saccharopolyspora sp. NPDC000359 TaxID=3154251 RepID=UPI003319F9BA
MTAPAAVLLPLLGTPCAVCAHPARWVDTTRHVVHVDLRLRPCPLPPDPHHRPVPPTSPR